MKVRVKSGRSSFTARVFVDEQGVRRFVGGLPRYLVDSHQVDLNQLAIDYHRHKIALKDYMRFYVGLGYSLSGFLDVFPDAEIEDI